MPLNVFDRDGQPITMAEWNKLHSDPDYTIIAQEDYLGARVSTVWLGIDYNHGEPPVIFETMIFDDAFDYCERYCTESEALDGHVRAKAWLRHKIDVTQITADLQQMGEL